MLFKLVTCLNYIVSFNLSNITLSYWRRKEDILKLSLAKVPAVNGLHTDYVKGEHCNFQNFPLTDKILCCLEYLITYLLT